MKLTEAQRRGIEERFAVLQGHILDTFNLRLGNDAMPPSYWLKRLNKDIEACRDEVITLIERLEPLLDGVDQ